jgi:nucleotide-binding universal stress UspA family protein
MVTVYEIVLGGVGSILYVGVLFVLTTARSASEPYHELSRVPLFEKLLLVLDDYRLNHSQLEFALYAARQLGANLTARFVLRGKASRTIASSLRHLAEKAEQLGVCAEVSTQHGQFRSVLRHLVSKHSPDYVVIGWERFAGVSLPRGYTTPTFVIPTQPKARFERLLVPFEDTPASFEVLEKAHDLAQRLGATLQPVHLLELPLTPPRGARAWMYVNREEVVKSFVDERERLKHRGKNLLFKVRQRLPKVVPELCETSPVEAGYVLERVARKQKTDLIVLSNMETKKLGRRFVRHLATNWPVLTL